ncbi:4'-phosphopantetheinyl transferase superfamily protein [Mesobacterium sp. TK19101]|uniref:Enterobactin synthase component D n=1 Tax=Mesobacterium hydrothermale TaxID=3111907 RepID=A0ABU6HFR5_9RHOB|nr:4'-phosphopantetheinyl transferase superfamily protein [Mesobacterium sp. TK19101]MEC3861300.1 4'-phosphopantetheinyl transferase superfamily protein [Mesobacterium sp. TK19101]
MSLHGLQRLLGEIEPDLSPVFCTGAADPHEDDDGLYPIEAAAVVRAVDKRRREFAAGRRAARCAMRKMGHAPQPVPAGDDRAPVWPRGLAGSISHTDFAALGIVSCQAETRTVGVDIEADQPIDPALVPEICTPEELDIGAPDDLTAARRIFSAKEAAYKAQFPLTATIFGFDGLHISALDATTLEARFTRDVPPFRAGDVLTVRQWARHGVILSLCALPGLPCSVDNPGAFA